MYRESERVEVNAQKTDPPKWHGSKRKKKSEFPFPFEYNFQLNGIRASTPQKNTEKKKKKNIHKTRKT